jgi:hypothetical protein
MNERNAGNMYCDHYQQVQDDPYFLSNVITGQETWAWGDHLEKIHQSPQLISPVTTSKEGQARLGQMSRICQ